MLLEVQEIWRGQWGHCYLEGENKIETLKEIINILRNIGIGISGITFVILMVKMTTEPENKLKYIKLSKHLLIATIFITLALSLIEIPKNYYGNNVEIVESQLTETTIEKIKDKDCQGRECVYIDQRWFVVTDENVKIVTTNEKQFYIYTEPKNMYGIEVEPEKYLDTYHELNNVDALRLFSECQGNFKGYFSEIHYYREEDGFIFPAWYTYEQYTNAKQEYVKNLEATQNEW